MAKKGVGHKTQKKITSSEIPMVEADFLVLVVVAVACFVLLGIGGYFLR